MSTAVAKRRDDGGPSRLHLAPARTTPKALLDRKCGNHLCQLTNLHIFDCVPSPMDLCAQPSATPSQTLSEGDKPPETDGVFKPVPNDGFGVPIAAELPRMKMRIVSVGLAEMRHG